MLTLANTISYKPLAHLANTVMERTEYRGMAKTRAMLTETEREQIAGEHGRERRYQATSRIRRRISEELTRDIEVLAEHNPELLEEIREVVCDE